MLTEPQAWLELARIFEPGKSMPIYYPDTGQRMQGICQGTAHLTMLGRISHRMEERMDDRLNEFFYPMQGDRRGESPFYWPVHVRTERAFACGFLAEMTTRKVHNGN